MGNACSRAGGQVAPERKPHPAFFPGDYVDPKLEAALKDVKSDNPWIVLLSPAQLVEIQQAFAKFDRDGDGHIEAKELRTVMNVMGISPTDEQLTEMIGAVDTDGNGAIEFEEFIELMARRMLKDDGQLELEKAFALFDADGSGEVTLSEVRDLMTSVGQGLSEDEIQELMTMADTDGNGKISLEEFKAMECWKIPSMWSTSRNQGAASSNTASVMAASAAELPRERDINAAEAAKAASGREGRTDQ